MAPISLPNRFMLILLFCLLSFLLFHWYLIRKCLKDLNKSSNEDETSLYSWIASPVHYQYQKAIAFINDLKFLEAHNKENEYTNKDELTRINNKLDQEYFKESTTKLSASSDLTFPQQNDALTYNTIVNSHHSTILNHILTNPVIESKNDFSAAIGNIYSEKSNPISYLLSQISFEVQDVSQAPNSEEISDRQTLTDYDYLSDTVKPVKNPAFIVDTPSCKIPRFDPWDPSVMELIHLYDPLICSDLPLFMTPESNGIVHLNASVLEKYYNATLGDMDCFYWAIFRKYEPEQVREDDFYYVSRGKLQFDTPLDDEHILAKCYFSDSYVHEQFLPLVNLKDKVEEEKSKVKSSSPLNIILLGIDSVSNLNFIRHFRKTKTFLEKMKFFDMKGYTKVGDNTFPNLVPMLTGHFVEYYFNESMKDTFFFDNISLIWKDYAKHGYRTFFADDSPYNGIFNYFKRGFFDPPTDYYYRPLALAIDHSELRLKAKHYEAHCLNSELETDLMYDYLKNFVKTMDKRPYFAFCMVSVLTHDISNYASYADAPAERILTELEKVGALNNSAVVIFSDHGIRYGEIRETYIGKFEERMPFMYIYFPKWFLNQYPNAEKSLSINQHRLITLFDIHATMKHLLNFSNYMVEETNELGLSLLNEIPESRTCEEASISKHFCPCNAFTEVSIDDPVVVLASQAIVKHINELLHHNMEVCETLELKEIKDARKSQPNEELLKDKGYVSEHGYQFIVLSPKITPLSEYQITLSVQPGGGIFEGTVRYDPNNDITSVMDISRINQYGSQSWCIDSPKLKLYCYCKQQIG